jgi:hypothetical protein
MPRSTPENSAQRKRKVPMNDNGEPITTGVKKKAKLTKKPAQKGSSKVKKPPPKKRPIQAVDSEVEIIPTDEG